MSQQELSDRLDQLGYHLDRATIARTEAGSRPVSVDDLLALAVALRVSPLHLVIPVEDHEEVRLTPSENVDAFSAREWFRGRLILHPGEDDRPYLTEVPDPELAFFRWPAIQPLMTMLPHLLQGMPTMGQPITVQDLTRLLDGFRIVSEQLTQLTTQLERERSLIEKGAS